jgi:TPR repeat protein
MAAHNVLILSVLQTRRDLVEPQLRATRVRTAYAALEALARSYGADSTDPVALFTHCNLARFHFVPISPFEEDTKRARAMLTAPPLAHVPYFGPTQRIIAAIDGRLIGRDRDHANAAILRTVLDRFTTTATRRDDPDPVAARMVAALYAPRRAPVSWSANAFQSCALTAREKDDGASEQYVKWLLTAINVGDPGAADELAEWHEKSLATGDSNAMALYLWAAGRRHPLSFRSSPSARLSFSPPLVLTRPSPLLCDATDRVLRRYARGDHGVTVDPARAVLWLRRAAAQGHALALDDLALMYAPLHADTIPGQPTDSNPLGLRVWFCARATRRSVGTQSVPRPRALHRPRDRLRDGR